MNAHHDLKFSQMQAIQTQNLTLKTNSYRKDAAGQSISWNEKILFDVYRPSLVSNHATNCELILF